MNRSARLAGRMPENALDDIARPFAGDLLERTHLADRLTTYIDRLREGTVIAIDASWGEGKTWFARNWAASLQRTGHPVAYLDAFCQNDELDPFFIIAAELAILLDDGQGTGDTIRGEAARLMNALVPLTGRLAALKTVALQASGTPLHDPAAGKASFRTASEDTENWIENRLRAYPSEKALFANFRQSLGRIVAASGKPAVIVLDELDRCRPSFAIRFLERIRHYFDMPNLVFVLPVTRIQLYEAVKSVYGPDTDAGAYLHKFVNFFLSLPAFPQNDPSRLAHIRAFIGAVFTRHGMDTTEKKTATLHRTDDRMGSAGSAFPSGNRTRHHLLHFRGRTAGTRHRHLPDRSENPQAGMAQTASRKRPADTGRPLARLSLENRRGQPQAAHVA